MLGNNVDQRDRIYPSPVCGGLQTSAPAFGAQIRLKPAVTDLLSLLFSSILPSIHYALPHVYALLRCCEDEIILGDLEKWH